MRTTLLLATSNKGKAREYLALLGETLANWSMKLVLLADYLAEKGEDLAEPEENGSTFAANAEIKARGYADQTGQVVLADDSGLCVSALEGRPGTLSARYGGAELSDLAKCEKLLEEMQGRTDRRAFFETAIVLAKGDGGRVLTYNGRLWGELTQTLAGEGGFGYDPLFRPLGSDRTLAEMDAYEKNKISHRRQAIASLLADRENVEAWLKS
ncbi:MAG: RdgB/HAM1 family non-canonical purine NTP pyrophosphatase [Deltaproteobacteria bacterium]|jgi:XTP/dITP diphosphohydrolase|nr:RdgB/HAM1 family non-canonical purine NTP pyrophosphatase [Deltaproteobacteria bacterium]